MEREPTREQISGTRLPTIYVPRLRCQECQSTDLRTYGTVGELGDGAYMTYVLCKSCGERFRLIEE